jgi:repressor LexA
MTLEKLTATQEKAFRFIERSIKRDGLAPTLRELCQYMGYSAVGSAQDIVRALKKKGYLKNLGKRAARSLIPNQLLMERRDDEVVSKSESYSESMGRKKLPHVVGAEEDQLIFLPILGQVPAGNPNDQTENNLGQFPVSRSILTSPTASPKDLFVLQAKGDSMIGAGILDGDWLIVKKSSDPEHGAIIVARVDGAVTVKRLIKDRKLSWCLQPENPHYPTMVGAEQPFEVVGRVVGLQRAVH